MSTSTEIRRITEVIELGFADWIADLAVKNGGYDVIRLAHTTVNGACICLRNRVGVDFIIEVEASWEPGREVV